MPDVTSSPDPVPSDAGRRYSSPRSSPSISRRSSNLRRKSTRNASTTSLKNTISDSQSLTSFPSLSPPPPTPYASHQIKPPPSSFTNSSSETQEPKTPPAFNGLFATPRDLDERGTLFDDAPKAVRDVPGILHLQSDDHVQKLIARNGSVALVKQLAADLAQRDAQVTRVQRRAEEREGLLKKMLRECEVSNIDIETRLRELDGKKGWGVTEGARRGSRRRSVEEELGALVEDSIHGRMSLALSESLISEGTLPISLNGIHSTHERHSLASNDTSRRSSLDAAARRDRQISGTASGGWKEYFTGGTNTVRRVSSKMGSNADANGSRHRSSLAGTTSTARLGSTLRNNYNSNPSGATSLYRTTSNSSSLKDLLRSEQDADAASINSSSSIASWALKFVGSSTGQPKEADIPSPARERAATVSVTSPRTNSPKGARLTKARSRGDNSQAALRGNRFVDALLTPSTNLGPSGTIKKVSPDPARNPLSAMITASNSQNSELNDNLGPVEMDTILPEDTRPPTLLPHNNRGSSDLLTDRFGFIYDQRRRRRQNEAVADATILRKSKHVETLENHRKPYLSGQNNEEDLESSEPVSPMQSTSQPGTPVAKYFGDADQRQKRWQDYLKISSFPTELLSHTPSAAPITSVTSAQDTPEDIDKPTPLHVAKRGSLPSADKVAASPSRIVSNHAELIRPAMRHRESSHTSSKSQPDPVKSLLDQLTEVHDMLQRERTVRWNDFLRKVRAERNRTGDTNAGSDTRTKGIAMPETTLNDGELIGIAGLGNKGKVGRAKWSEFRGLVMGGIPVAYRAKIWAECSGATGLRIPGYYEDLVHSTMSDPTIVQQIQMDITRTLTDNIFFRKGPGVEKLKEVLSAYARRNPEIGYCQGMNIIAANLLLIMPTTEDAFWVLTSMIENILPEKYYDSSLLASRADQVVLRQYVTEILPQLSDHLEELSIELEALTFQWFLSVFTDCLSAEALFRVWDVVLCINDGASFLFQVALALLKLNELALLACESPAEIYGYINQQMTDHAISIDGLIRASEALKKVVKREDVLERRRLAIEAEMELIRQREATRKGKRRAAEGDRTTAQTTPRRDTVAVMATKMESPSISRKSSYMRVLEDEFDEYADLQIRTPMPIDEEIEWRG